MMDFLNAAELFRKCWALYRSYYSVQFDDSAWEQILKEADTLFEEFNKQPFAKELICAVILELERHCRPERSDTF